MVNDNFITPHQETILRRVDRRFQITRQKNKLRANLITLPIERISDGIVQKETFNHNLTIENHGANFVAVLRTKTYWRRNYWTRWRVETKQTIFINENFHKLVGQIKSAL